jgi:hypothetical protein
MSPQSRGNGNPWWGEEQEKGFKNKRALTNALALSLPDVIKLNLLYVHKRLGAVGVLTQLLSSWHHPVAYLSKELNAVSQRWPLLTTADHCCLGG